jgi:hypothetical protein
MMSSMGVFPTMEIKKIHAVGLQATQAQIHLLLEGFRPVVDHSLAIQDVQPRLGGQDDVRAMPCQRVAEELLILPSAVKRGRIEQGYAAFQGVQQQLCTDFRAGGRSIRMIQVHTPQPEAGDSEWAQLSRRYLQHRVNIR